MMALPRIIQVAAISTAVVTTAVTAYALIVNNRVSRIDRKRITDFHDVPESFRNSVSMRKVVNPRGHATSADTRFMTLDIPASHRHITDEAILARFVKEFYNGWVFTPERYLLKLFGRDLVGFPETASFSPPSRAWDMSALSAYSLPPLHSEILGAWQILDVNLTKYDEGLTHRESYIDVAFGNGGWRFAGSNRFSVERLNEDEDKNGDGSFQIRLTYTVSCCNPLANKRPMPNFMIHFHDIYAMLLYREAMGGLKQWLDEPLQPQLAH